jgi:hypothetical protein
MLSKAFARGKEERLQGRARPMGRAVQVLWLYLD